MIRYLRYAFLAVIGITLVSVSLANRGPVTLKLIPEGLEPLMGQNFQVTLPLFIVVLGGVAAGLVIGFIWEWMREYKHRREAAQRGREAKKLAREVDRLKEERHAEKDDVLAILDKTG